MKKQNRMEKINEITKQPSWESRRDFITYPSKIVHECNGHLEIFSLPQAIENSKQILPLQARCSETQHRIL